MEVIKKITFSFNEEESVRLQHIANLFLKSKSIINKNITPDETGHTNDIYDEKDFAKMVQIAKDILGAS